MPIINRVETRVPLKSQMMCATHTLHPIEVGRGRQRNGDNNSFVAMDEVEERTRLRRSRLKSCKSWLRSHPQISRDWRLVSAPLTRGTYLRYCYCVPTM